MNFKFILGLIVIVVAIVFASVSFTESNVKYMTFNEASYSGSKAQVKGEWLKEKSSIFDAEKNTFTFFMIDDEKTEFQVILNGAKPNNFEIAESIVAKGKCSGNTFVASTVLTKCPSKYEGNSEALNKTI